MAAPDLSSPSLDVLHRRIAELERENRALAERAAHTVTAERAHRLSESRFRALFEQFPMSVQIFSPEGKTLAVNRAWHELFGLTFADVADFNPLHDPQFAPVREYLQRGFAGEIVTIPPHAFDAAPFNGDPGKDRTKWLEVTVWPVRDGDDAISEVIVVHRDVTDRIETEEALRASEESYRTIFDLSSDAVFVHDIETGAILDANRKACALYGCDLDALRDLGIGGISDGAPPYDTGHARDFVRRAAAGEPQRFEWLIQQQDGERLWVEVALHRVRIGGADRVLANVRDIDDRKHAEAALQRAHDELEQRVEARTAELAHAERRFRAIAEASPVPLLLSRIDDGTVVFANDRIEALVGAPPDGLVGRKTPDFYYDPADRPGILGQLQEQGFVRGAELRIRRFDGTPRWVSLSIQSLVFDEAPTLVTALIDITERKEVEEALRDRTQELEAIFRALPDLYFRMEADGTILAYRAGRAFGLYTPPDAFMGERVYDVLPDPVGGQIRDALSEVAETGDLVCFEYLLPLGDERRDFEARLLPLDDGQVIAIVRDITEQKQAEEALRLSEESYRGLFDALTELVYIQDLEGRFLAVNEAVVRAYGYARDEVVGRTPEFLGVPGLVDPDAFADTFAKAVAGEPQRFEWWGRRKDGSAFPKDVVIKRSTYFGQDVVIAVARDVTVQKEAEQALRRSEEHFRRLIENGMDLIQLIDAEGTTTYVSPSVERLTGYTPEEMIGQPAQSGLHRDDLDDAMASLAEAVANPGTTQRAEYRIRHKDGSWRVFEGYGRTFAPDSADEGVVINARDITERKRFDEALREREEHFRRLTENASDLIQVVGPGGGITYTSPSVERLLGYTPDEIAAASVLDFIHADDHDGVEAEMAALFGAPGVVRATTYRVRHRDGRWRTFEARGRTLSPTSAAEGIVVNARDVTERVEAEETLRLQKTLLEAQGEASIDGILVVSPTGQMVSFNRRFVEMWEIPAEVVASHSDEAALQAVVDQLDDPDEFLARVAYLYDRPDEESRDEIRLRDGRVFDRYSAPVRSQQGDYYGRIWFFRDITDQKRSEEALRLSHEREREHAQRLERELEVGRQIQRSFLPAELLSPAGWEVDTRFRPASQVAGDFYDTFGLPIGRVGLIVADVCGKGVGAALFMALFRSLLRAHAERASAARMGTPHAAEAVLKEAVNATNQYIARVHKPSHLRTLGHTFASVFFGLLDPQTGTLHYVNAGHEPPLVIGPNGPRLRLPPTGPALGLTADATLEVETTVIAPNETLLAYTDGVTEARSEDGGFFDEERLLALLDEPAPSASALLDRIEHAVNAFAAETASDDLTLMAVRRGPR